MPVFLVIDLPRMTTPMAVFTRTRPGLALDFFVRPAPAGKPGAGPFRVLCMAQGPPADVEELHGIMAKTYPTFRKDHPAGPGGWIASYQVPSGPVDPVFIVAARYLDEKGLRMRWGRAEKGVVRLRALVEDEGSATRHADALRAQLVALDPLVRVAVESAPEATLGIWLEVLRRASEEDLA